MSSQYANQKLYDTVIRNGYCIGCGVCASIKDSPFDIQFNYYGMYQAYLKNNSNYCNEVDVNKICPFSNDALNEDEIGQMLYQEQEGQKYNFNIGYYLQCYAGYVCEDDFRENGSSGGIATWILNELLSRGLVDGVICVQENHDKQGPLFSYQLGWKSQELKKGAKSKYYPVELSRVLKYIRDKQGKYAIIGVPCFIKAIRLLSMHDPVIKERIKYCVGLVCGHLKSKAFAEFIGWQLGIHPKNLISIDFRKKLSRQKANEYGVEVKGLINHDLVMKTDEIKNLMSSNWRHGMFKYQACEFCDDVFAETADVTIGDAWLPDYIKDEKGTNIIIIRDKKIDQIIREGHVYEKLKLNNLSLNDIVLSQSSGLRHRREGLSYRLYLKKKIGEWTPTKRCKPMSKNISRKRKKIYHLRLQITNMSHIAYRKAIEMNDIQIFFDELNPLLIQYNKLHNSLLRQSITYLYKKLKY